MKNIIFCIIVLGASFMFLQFSHTVLVPLFLVVGLLQSIKGNDVEIIVNVVGSCIIGVLFNIMLHKFIPNILSSLSSQFQVGGETYDMILQLLIDKV